MAASVALVVIAVWTGTLALGLTSDLSLATPAHALEVLAFIALRTLSYVGLFITAHDAMHGTVASGRRRLNDAVGAVALALYAWLPFARLKERHGEHHAAPARPGDPDWCADQRFLPWLWSFVRHYVDAWVIVRNAAFVTALVALGASPLDALVLHALPAWLSVVQLFTFGTWLPHRGAHDDDVHRARSADVSPLVSFVSCYHFGYHLEHHRAPHVPWWRLPAERARSIT